MAQSLMEAVDVERLAEHGEAGSPLPAAHLRPGRFVQLLKTYVATAADEGLLIFDQHALHERVLYRHLREQWRRKSIRRQARAENGHQSIGK